MRQNGLGVCLLLLPNGHECVSNFVPFMFSFSSLLSPLSNLFFSPEGRPGANNPPTEGWTNQPNQQPAPPGDWKAFYENLKSGVGGGLLTSSQLKEDTNVLSLSGSGEDGYSVFTPNQMLGASAFLKSSEGNGAFLQPGKDDGQARLGSFLSFFFFFFSPAFLSFLFFSSFFFFFFFFYVPESKNSLLVPLLLFKGAHPLTNEQTAPHLPLPQPP